MSRPFRVHLMPDYNEARFKKLAKKEGEGENVYGCTSAIPTIGYGFALLLGHYDKKLKKTVWKVRPGIREDLKAVNALKGDDLTDTDKKNLKKVEDLLNTGKSKTEIIKFISTQKYSFSLDEKQARQLFENISNRYDAELKRRLKRPVEVKEKIGKKIKVTKVPTGLSDDQIKRLQGTREWAALYSTVYRGSVCITSSMVDALKAGNRQENWYAMKYDTAMVFTSRPEGIFNRSTDDAKDFGLYDDPDNPTDEECQNLIEVYKKHTDKIKAYDMAGHRDPFLPYLEKAEQQLKTHGKDPHITLYSLPKRTTPAKKRKPHTPSQIPKSRPTKKTRTPVTETYWSQLQKTVDKWETYARQRIRERWW